MDQAGHLAWTDLSGASRSKRGEASEKLPSAFSHLPIGASLQMATFTASVGPSRSIDGRSCCEETLLTPPLCTGLTQIDARGADFLAAVSEASLGEVSSRKLPAAFL